MLKKCGALVLVLMLILSIAGCQLCIPDVSDASTPMQSQTPITNDAVVSEDLTYSLRLVHESDLKIQGVYGISEGLALVYGEYKGQQGFFYVDESGKVLNDAVYYYAGSFNHGWTYMMDAQGVWYVLYKDGRTEKTTDPSTSKQFERKMTEIDGEERFYIIDNLTGKESDAIFSWIESADGEYNYATLVNAEHPNVLIDSYGETLITLPDDCRGATVGDSALVGKFNDKNGGVFYRPLDYTGKIVGKHTFQALTHQSLWLSAACMDGNLVLVDDKGEIVLKTDIAFDDNADDTCLAFEEDRLVMLNKDGKMAMYCVELKEESLRRVALNLLNKASEIGGFYRSENGDLEVKLSKGTVIEMDGRSVTLEEDYYRFSDTMFGETINTMAALKKGVESAFTAQAAYDHFYSRMRYVEKDGALYSCGGGRGYLPVSIPGSLTLLSVTEDKVTFSFAEQYNYFNDVEVDTYTMVKSADGWRLDTFFEGVFVD